MMLKQMVPLVAIALLYASPVFAADATGQSSPGSAEPMAKSDGKSTKGMNVDFSKAKMNTRTAPPLDELEKFKRSGPKLKAKDFGAVVVKRGGKVSTEPVAPEVKELLKESMGPLAPATDKNPSFKGDEDEEEGTPDKRTVFGADERVWIQNASSYPFRTIGLLHTVAADGSESTCSGTLIQPGYVLTAAHCLYDETKGQHMNTVDFYPGFNDGYAPFGYVEADSWIVMSGYVNAPCEGYCWDRVQNDVGVIKLAQRAGDELGWLGFNSTSNLSPFVGNIVGYPNDKPNLTMWRTSCNVDTQLGRPNTFEQHCDTAPGSSGAGIYDYEKAGPNRTIYGVSVAETQDVNIGVRLSPYHYCWVVRNIGLRC